jgi:hypothetical protein
MAGNEPPQGRTCQWDGMVIHVVSWSPLASPLARSQHSEYRSYRLPSYPFCAIDARGALRLIQFATVWVEFFQGYYSVVLLGGSVGDIVHPR